jgi:hypothetical protein
MFRSPLFDHPQGLSFVLSASTTFPLVCFVQLFIRYVAVCCLQCNVCIRMIPWFFIYQYMKNWCMWQKKCGLTYVCVGPMYLSVGCLVVKCLLLRVRAARSSYKEFGSLTYCSVMSTFCWRYIWMYMFSQWFIFLLFLHGCINFRVSLAVPYSCLLFSICVAYSEARLLVLMYLIRSLCLVMCLPEVRTMLDSQVDV